MGQTPNHSYNVPSEGTTDWHVPLNANFRAYDTDIELRDTADSRSQYQPKNGAKFLATDTGVVSLGDGSSWTAALALGRYEPTGETAAGNLVFGHPGNTVASGVVAATISGGGLQDAAGNGENRVEAGYGTVGGGSGNVTSGLGATISGGISNEATRNRATVGGGEANTVRGADGTVAGGENNTVEGAKSTVGGGGDNDALDDGATVAGGTGNTADGTGATVAGGDLNTAAESHATVAGGQRNTVSAAFGTIGGGASPADSTQTNTVLDQYGTIAGGAGNVAGTNTDSTDDARYATVAGGQRNAASGTEATVGGGVANDAAAVGATVPGGSSNAATGAHSFAAGRRANAEADGAFVWGDSTETDVRSTITDEFKAHSTGGAVFFTADDFSTGVAVGAGEGTWSSVSARSAKRNVEPVDSEAVLDALERLDVSRWEYDTSSEATHIGPMAGPFHDAFGVGRDAEHIDGVDADGVALAAIQALSDRLSRRSDRIDGLEAELDEKTDRIDGLEAELDAKTDRIDSLEAELDAKGEAITELTAAVEALREQIGGSGAENQIGGSDAQHPTDSDAAE